MKKIVFSAIIFCLWLSAFSRAAGPYEGKKILFINSYHKGYFWSDGETYGLKQALEGTGVNLKIIYMDTKNNSSEEFKEQAGLKVKRFIDGFKPDVVISADDNAFKYVIVPYCRDGQLPVVFCGINWDISVYGAPYTNTTGMIEVGLYESIYRNLRKFSKGSRTAFLGVDVLSSYKNAEYFNKVVEGGFSFEEHVKDFQSWKKKYIELQDKVDILILDTTAGIKGWDDKEAEKFALENTRIIVGTESESLIRQSLIAVSKVAREQGQYAAKTALRILDGERPRDIPLVNNKKGNLFLNLIFAKKLNVVFTPAMLRSATEIIGIEDY